MYCDIMS
jgi:integrase